MKAILLCALFLAALTSTPCRASPNSVRKMDAVTIQSISESKLCDAYGVWLSQGKSYPVIEAEVARRRITCGDWLEASVSDCSKLEVVNIDTSNPRGAIFTVTNNASKPKSFRVLYKGMQSSIQYVNGSSTKSFGVEVDPRIAAIGGVQAALRGESQAVLNECLTPR